MRYRMTRSYITAAALLAATAAWAEPQSQIAVPPEYAIRSGTLDPTQSHEIRTNQEWYCDCLFAVRVGTKWSYIDATGRLVLPPVFDHASARFFRGHAIVGLANQSFIIDSGGRVCGRVASHRAFVADTDIVCVDIGNGTWQYHTFSGKAISSTTFRVAGPFSADLAWVGTPIVTRREARIDDNESAYLWWQVDRAIEPVRPEVGHLKMFQESQLQGVFDQRSRKWEIRYAPGSLPLAVVDNVWTVSEGYVVCLVNNRWFVLDSIGNVVLGPYKYSPVRGFECGVAEFRKGPGPQQVFINTAGEIVWESPLKQESSKASVNKVTDSDRAMSTICRFSGAEFGYLLSLFILQDT